MKERLNRKDLRIISTLLMTYINNYKTFCINNTKEDQLEAIETMKKVKRLSDESCKYCYKCKYYTGKRTRKNKHGSEDTCKKYNTLCIFKNIDYGCVGYKPKLRHILSRGDD